MTSRIQMGLISEASVALVITISDSGHGQGRMERTAHQTKAQS
jgi:hypothetical protein